MFIIAAFSFEAWPKEQQLAALPGILPYLAAWERQQSDSITQ